VKAFDVAVELGAVYAPNATAADLYGRELARTNEGINLRDADRQIGRHVLVLVMSAALVISVWGLVQERLLNIVTTALSNVCGSVGC
jgi:hypothetical protein